MDRSRDEAYGGIVTSDYQVRTDARQANLFMTELKQMGFSEERAFELTKAYLMGRKEEG